MEIKPLDLTVKTLLESSFYKIPRFQRPYSWDRENVSDFWEDAILSDEPDYFIGSFVLYRSKEDDDLLFIVDGQQRLTTITLMLAATRDALNDLKFKSLAVAVQKLIEREDINSELRFVLDSETPYPYLQANIQKYGEEREKIELGSEQKALEAAYEFFGQQIASTLLSIDADKTIAEEEKNDEKRTKLILIRDRVLRLQLITVQLGSEDDAYLIFETLNTRGKDLTVSDLVKNHLTRLLRPTHRGVDLVKDKWNGILDHFDQSEVDININRFLHHSWLSRYQYITEKKLFKEIKRTVKKRPAKNFLDYLISDSEIYRQILEPNSHKWNKEERFLAESLRALMLFRVVQPVPMLIALMRNYRDDSLTIKQTRNVLQRMENFHVQFTAVTSQRTGGGTALMYASSARQLLEAKDRNAEQQILSDFVGKLRDRVPIATEFEAGFSEISFTNWNTRSRQIAQYLLRRLDMHLRTGPMPDYDNFTIEHLAPQNPAGKVAVSRDRVGKMGNLLLVDAKLNERLKNMIPGEKLKILKREAVPLDQNLANADDWTNELVEARTTGLATLFREEVFKV